VPFPPEFAARYRERGYWRDRSLRQELGEAFARFGDRVALIDGHRTFTYAELDRLSDTLALGLLELGLAPLDRVVVQLPNVWQFVVLYVALQKVGAIPVLALPSHRYAEVRQFAEMAGAVACVYPARHGDFAFAPMIDRVRRASASVRLAIVLGEAGPDELSLSALIERPGPRAQRALATIAIDATDPCAFQLSGGTTGVPKLIPRTHNDYAYNSRAAAEACEVSAESVLLLALPIAHNLPLACPGLQGFFFHGARVVLCPTTRPEEMLPLIERHRVTHLKVVPALLIRLLDAPAVRQVDTSSLRIIQSGGQRLQPELRKRAQAVIPGCFVQENFGMAEGLLMFVRRDDPEDVRLETVGRPISPDDEVRLLDDAGRDVPDGEVGELCARGPYTLRGYYGVPAHNATAFTPDGFYRSGDLMRRHPSGNYVVEGRRKDLINRGGEKISAEEIENLILTHRAVQNVACVPVSDPLLGERMCACVILRPGSALTLEELVAHLAAREIAKFKLPERLEVMAEFPLSTFGKVSKQALVETISRRPARGVSLGDPALS